MKKLLQEISKRALLLNEYDFTHEQSQSKWLGVPPATDEQIEKAQALLQLELPADYIEFLKITNGFHACINTGMTFLPIDKIDYLINVDEDLVEIWHRIQGLEETVKSLSESLLVGGLNEEQYFLLIPPNQQKKKWRYWKFANWMAGEDEFETLKDYFKSELSFLKQQTKGLKKPKPKFVTDFSLRDYLLNADWEKVYNTAFRFLKESVFYHYINGEINLLRILLLSASKTNSFEKLQKDLREFRETGNLHDWLEALISKYEGAARNEERYVPDLLTNNFSVRPGKITLAQIEEQIKMYRPELLKPKNIQGKREYQLYFLFDEGNAHDFITLYRDHLETNFSDTHLKAAIVYATLNHFADAENALERYFKFAFDYRPLEPFFEDVLGNILTAEFSRRMLIQFKQPDTH